MPTEKFVQICLLPPPAFLLNSEATIASTSPKPVEEASPPPLLPVPTTMTPTSSNSMLRALMQWDKDVSFLIYRHYNTNFPRLLLLILEVSGHGVPWIAAPILIFLFKENLSAMAASLMFNFLAITALDLAAIGILKPLFHRTRPAYNSGIGHVTIHAVDQFSFPSGHATRAALVASFLFYVQTMYPEALQPMLASSLFMLFTFVWATAVCASRVALGRHHVVDVVAGAVIGASYLVFWHMFWVGADSADQFRHMFRHTVLGTIKMLIMGPSSWTSNLKDMEI